MTFGFRAFSWNAIDAIGPDAGGWLGGIVTCDLPQRPSDGARWGLLLSKQGKIQAELVITSSGSAGLSIAVRGGDAESVREVLDRHLVMEDVELGAVGAVAWAILVRPSAAELERLTGAGVDVCSLPAPFTSADAVLVRGEGNVQELEQSLSGLGHELVGDAWDGVRVELGLPLFGVDFDEADNPHQAALERRAVSWQKGCYLGQEVVFMQDARGKVKRRLVRLTSEADVSLAAGDSVTTEAGEEVGQLTTAALGRALGKLSSPHFEPGSTVWVGSHALVVEALDAGLYGRTGAPGSIQK